MSSKINLLKKKIANIQAQLKVEMAKNSKVSDGTLPIPKGKKKTIVKRTALKVMKRPKDIGKIKEIKAKRVIRGPKVIGNNDKRKRY